MLTASPVPKHPQLISRPLNSAEASMNIKAIVSEAIIMAPARKNTPVTNNNPQIHSSHGIYMAKRFVTASGIIR